MSKEQTSHKSDPRCFRKPAFRLKVYYAATWT